MTQDTPQLLLDLSNLINTHVPWLPANSVRVTSPPTPYPPTLPKPWGLLRGPRLSRAHRESGDEGNAAGRPDTLSFYYLETQYVPTATKVTEETRVYQTYDLVAELLVTQDGGDNCVDSVQQTIDVSLETKAEGPFVDMGALGIWIGGLIIIRLERRFD